jgi:tRNA dimethylallyltransferase
MPFPKVLALVGPTASGKTGLSYLIANLIKEKLYKEPVIVSADSRQVYKYIPISSSYPPPEYLEKFRHHFIGELELDGEFNAGEYGKKAREIVKILLAENKVPIIVGGSGLYVSSLIYGLFEHDEAVSEAGFKEKQKLIRHQLSQKLEKEGAEALLDELRRVDLVSAEKMTGANQRRILRALEVYYTTGIPISELQTRKIDVGFLTVQFGLKWERSKLYERINNRVEQMLISGLINEINLLKEKGYNYTEYNSLNTVGVREVFDYLSGTLTYERMVELVKQNTRRFAKRQLTWFRKDENIKWIEVNDENDFKAASQKIFDLFFNR